MKLTGDLKEKVEAAESEQEKRTIIAQAGMLLTDDELAEVSGGEVKDLTVETSVELEGSTALRPITPWNRLVETPVKLEESTARYDSGRVPR